MCADAPRRQLPNTVMNFSETATLCFVASYAVALSMELAGLVRRVGGRRLVMLGAALVGVGAHLLFLVNQTQNATAPLASPAEWCSVAALTLACIYLYSSIASPRQAIGLFLLPVVLLLLGMSSLASHEPFAPQRASLFWGKVHGWLLMLATVTVIVGFLAGLMYLIQSWRLKHKLPPDSRFRLPTLEALETTIARSLAISVALVAGGFASGLVLAGFRQTQGHGLLWQDPLVISLTLMLVWLVTAELFRLLYPSARRGRKVAYLTVASFGFLMIVLATMLWSGADHGSGASRTQVPGVEQAPPRVPPAPPVPGGSSQ